MGLMLIAVATAFYGSARVWAWYSNAYPSLVRLFGAEPAGGVNPRISIACVLLLVFGVKALCSGY